MCSIADPDSGRSRPLAIGGRRFIVVFQYTPVSTDTDGEPSHERAADAFVERARRRSDAGVESIYVFGSTARGEAAGLSSDVDVFVVLEDDAAPKLEDELRDIAYDVMLEYGPVVELHTISASSFSEKRRTGHPFVQRVVSEGVRYD